MTLPNSYYRFFEKNNRCEDCRQPLRHYLHAYNHFKKYHHRKIAKKQLDLFSPEVKYFIWVKERQEWIRSTMFQTITAKIQNRPIATVKR